MLTQPRIIAKSFFPALILLCLGVAALSFLSRAYPYDTHPLEGPFWLYVGIGILTGGAFLTLLLSLRSMTTSPLSYRWIFAIGIGLRLIMFPSQPVLEDDFYRYLWDGAVVSAGENPYRFAPAEITQDLSFGMPSDAPAVAPRVEHLRDLAVSSGVVMDRINYPFLTTVYPPIAQAGFALAHRIAPFELWGFKLVLFAADCAAFFLLLKLLSLYGRSPHWALLYWWNPVILVQGFGAGHMDVLLVPALLGVVLASKAGRAAIAGACLALAVGVKIWPLLLAPIFIRLLWPSRFAILRFLVTLGSMTALLLAPQVFTIDGSGAATYAESWHTHSFLFSILVDGVFAAFSDPDLIARGAVFVIVTSLTLWAALRAPAWRYSAVSASTIAVTALFLFSPTGYPWYLIWIAPFIPFIPWISLGTLVLTAPLYQVRFVLGDDAPLYTWGVLPLAFGVPIALLFLKDRLQHTQERAAI